MFSNATIRAINWLSRRRRPLECEIRRSSRCHCLTSTELPVVQDAIEKADVLIEAMGWIRQFRDKITVIKLGGSVMEDPDALRHLLVDIVFMETVGMRPVVVHGGGAAITRAMAEAGLEPRFIQGRRYTDDATLEIVERVLADEINEAHRRADRRVRRPGDAAQLRRRTNNNVLFGERLTLPDDDGEPIDLGHVGDVTRVDRDDDREPVLRRARCR